MPIVAGSIKHARDALLFQCDLTRHAPAPAPLLLAIVPSCPVAAALSRAAGPNPIGVSKQAAELL
jgi:hypothetical protein